MKTPYTSTIEALLGELETDAGAGLSASSAEERLKKYGANTLKAKKEKTLLQRFAEQFKDVMIIILIAAAAVSFVLAAVEGKPSGFFEPALIILIVILNAVLGVIQESRAEKALDALKGMSAPHARVLRDGKEAVIDAARLVPGDVILLEAGDFVPADGRLIRSANLKCEESALTGESVPAEKSAQAAVDEGAALGDRTNMVYSGCSVTSGTAAAVVTATGMDSEMGRIAGLLSGEKEEMTPLQKKLAGLGKYLGIAALAACAVIFIIGIIDGIPAVEMFMTAVSLAVAAIPEGLPAIVTIVLAVGVQRMVKRNAIVRRLPAVETLGSASVICSDKTGTLTQNRMTLTAVYTGGEIEELKDGAGERARELLEAAALCCNGSVVRGEDGSLTHIGDPTETAVILAAMNEGMTKESLAARCPRIFELPFDSERKMMTTVNEIGGRKVVIVKGAFDMIAPRCISGDIKAAEAACAEMSAKALRVLAVAVKTIDGLPEDPDSETLESGLAFMGLVGMIDPPREEAKNAVAVCRRAGIKPVMITGDHVITATAIARELGIMNDGDEAVTGAELEKMSEKELSARVRNISVYARVSPEDKIRIVKAWQSKGETVAMTGDGVNDAPALKAADIGCAMGITGTDVAKGAADMTLTDDNFATIVEAVREGRGIFDNIKKVVGFLLGTNIGEILTVFCAMLFWRSSPLLSMQLLWINLVTDSLPAIALGRENVEPDVMERKPKPAGESIFAHGYGLRTVLQGIMFGALSLIAFSIGRNATGETAGGQTLTFMVLALSQVIHSLNMRSERSIFKIGLTTNKTLNRAFVISVLMIALVLFTPVRIAFGMLALPAGLYFAGLGLSLVPVAVLEISKAGGLIRHQR